MNTERTTTCPHCGQGNPALQVYCAHCERPVRREAPSPRKRQRKSRVILEAASYRRVLGAQLADLGVLIGVGIGSGVVRTLFVEKAFVPASTNPLEWLVNLVQAYPQGISTAVVAGCLYGIVASLFFGVRGGRSPGRMAAQSILVSMAGKRLTPQKIALRTGMIPVSLVCCGAGFFWAILDPYHRTWHDLIAGTVLVDRRIRLPKSKAKPSPRRHLSSSVAQ